MAGALVLFVAFRTAPTPVTTEPATRAAVSAEARTEAPPLPDGARPVETLHYVIHTSATTDQTRAVGRAVEGLRRAYIDRFGAGARVPGTAAGRLELVLYRDRAHFKAHNRSRRWAEAYYLPPRAHAYVDAGRPNAHHWMLHEATHQLMREYSRFPRARWSDEGIAAYFGASVLDRNGLHPGRVDTGAYPVWWLATAEASGSLLSDIDAARIIPIHALLDGAGRDFDRAFNQYYLQYWSLAHFLFHGRGGRYAAAFRRVVADESTADAFERHLGSIERIEAEWYVHHFGLVRMAASNRLHGSTGPE